MAILAQACLSRLAFESPSLLEVQFGAAMESLAATLGYSLRRAKRVLPAGLRRTVVVDHIAVALELVAELRAPVPEVVRKGGLPLLVALAGGSCGSPGPVAPRGVRRGDLHPGAQRGQGAAAVGGVPSQGCSAGFAPAIACPPPAAAATRVAPLRGVRGGTPLLPRPDVPLRVAPYVGAPRRRCRAASRRGGLPRPAAEAPEVLCSVAEVCGEGKAGVPEDVQVQAAEAEADGEVAEAVVPRDGAHDSLRLPSQVLCSVAVACGEGKAGVPETVAVRPADPTQGDAAAAQIAEDLQEQSAEGEVAEAVVSRVTVRDVCSQVSLLLVSLRRSADFSLSSEVGMYSTGAQAVCQRAETSLA